MYKIIEYIFWFSVSIYAIFTYFNKALITGDYRTNLTTLLFGIVLLLIALDRVFNIKRFLRKK